MDGSWMLWPKWILEMKQFKIYLKASLPQNMNKVKLKTKKERNCELQVMVLSSLFGQLRFSLLFPQHSLPSLSKEDSLNQYHYWKTGQATSRWKRQRLPFYGTRLASGEISRPLFIHHSPEGFAHFQSEKIFVLFICQQYLKMPSIIEETLVELSINCSELLN